MKLILDWGEGVEEEIDSPPARVRVRVAGMEYELRQISGRLDILAGANAIEVRPQAANHIEIGHV